MGRSLFEGVRDATASGWEPGVHFTPFSPWTETGNYTCEFCGKQYKYYTPYQEHVALHAPISEYLFQRRDGAEMGEPARHG
jgi:hypothetical protein